MHRQPLADFVTDFSMRRNSYKGECDVYEVV